MIMGSGEMRRLLGAVEKNFPGLSGSVEVCMSVVNAMNLKDYENPLGMILVGVPSSGKTTTLDMFEGDFFIPLDDWTPEAFVSHVSKKRKKDLLEVMRHKCLVTAEMGPFFSKKTTEDLSRAVAYIVRIFDGKGFMKGTGNLDDGAIKGHRGDYRFSWLGATTPFSNKVWNVMGKLGNRLLFYNLEAGKMAEDLDWRKERYSVKMAECQKHVRRVLRVIPYSYEWDDGNDDREQVFRIVKLSILLCKLRAVVHVWKGEKDESGKSEYEFLSPMIEDNKRCFNQLYLIARGRAMLYGRDRISKDDVDMVSEIVKASAPYERHLILTHLVENGGSCSYDEMSEFLNCSPANITRIVKKLDILRICEHDKFEGHVKLSKDFSWLVNGTSMKICLSLEDRVLASIHKHPTHIKDVINRFNGEDIEPVLEKLKANGQIMFQTPTMVMRNA